MTDDLIIAKTTAFVKVTLQSAEGGHDWFHIERVLRNSQLIAKEELVNSLTVQLAALLHDIADAKFNNGDERLGPSIATKFLNSLEVPKAISNHVVAIIENISFRSNLENSDKIFYSKELAVVQDADRLDAMGAIGIARAFNYGGFKNRSLYDPEISYIQNISKSQYKNSTAPTINHFYEKLLLLKDQMNTATGKKLAESRHVFMLAYLKQFMNEWNPLDVSQKDSI